MINKYLQVASLVWLFFSHFSLPVLADSHELYRVTEILDGDTIRIDTGDKVRLVGIDAPEVSWSGKPLECWGEQAHYYLTEVLLNQEIYLDHAYTSDTRDVNGRLLAYVYKYLNDTDINKHMIETGYARNYLEFTHPRENEFANVENSARNEKLGFWGNTCHGSTLLQINLVSNRTTLAKTHYSAPHISRFLTPNILSDYYTGN